MSAPLKVFLGLDPGHAVTAAVALDEVGRALGSFTLRPASGMGPWQIVELVKQQLLILENEVLSTLKLIEGPDFDIEWNVCVEGQTIRRFAKTPPQDIVKLSFLAGAILGAVCTYLGSRHALGRVEVPEAHRWKGEVPKPIHHRRVLAALGWDKDDVSRLYSPLAGRIRDQVVAGRGSGKDLGDALGMAAWLLQERRA